MKAALARTQSKTWRGFGEARYGLGLFLSVGFFALAAGRDVPPYLVTLFVDGAAVEFVDGGLVGAFDDHFVDADVVGAGGDPD